MQPDATVRRTELLLAANCTAAQAIESLNLPVALFEQGMVGLWGRKCQAHTPLCAHDRLELYRPLTVDPKVARRERFGQQGARTAGLFARRREGAKQGY